MRRAKNQTSEVEAWAIFDKSSYATIGLLTPEGDPYCVVVSPARIENRVYFHCALDGKKLDCIRNHAHVCLSTVKQIDIVEAIYTVNYESCIIEGNAYIVTDEQERIAGLRVICERFAPTNMNHFDTAVEKSMAFTCIVAIDVESITGKKKASI